MMTFLLLGHTIVANGKKYPFHLLPCGILYPHTKNVLGNGTVIHLPTMFEELKQLERDNICYKNRLLISDRAHLVTSITIAADSKSEDNSKSKFVCSPQGPLQANRFPRLIPWNYETRHRPNVREQDEQIQLASGRPQELGAIRCEVQVPSAVVRRSRRRRRRHRS